MIENYCYVVPPATFKANEWGWVYDVLIKPIAEKRGMKCDLGQIMGEPGTLIDNILSKLLQAELAIVDITGGTDPRVFYQLGVRHARSNRTILVCQHDTDIFNDFRPYHVITYSAAARDITNFQAQLLQTIDTIRGNPDEPDNPVQRFLGGVGKLMEEKQALAAKLAEMEQSVRENKDLQNKVEELERTLTTLASAPQQPPHETIKFKPVPPTR